MRLTFLAQCLLPAVALAGVIARDDNCTTLTTRVKFSSAFTSVLSTGHGASTTFASLATAPVTNTGATSGISKSSVLSTSHDVSTTGVNLSTAPATNTKATSSIPKSSILSTSHRSSTTCVESTTAPATHTKATSKSSMQSRSHTGATTRVNSTTVPATNTEATSGISKSSMIASSSLSTTHCPTHSLNGSTIYHWPTPTTMSGRTRSLHTPGTIASDIESFPTIIYGPSTSASSHLASSLSETTSTTTHKTSHLAISSTTTKCSTTHRASAVSPTTTYSHSHTGPGKTTISSAHHGTFTSPHWTNRTTLHHSTPTTSFASGTGTTSGLHWSMPPLWSDRYPTTRVLPTGSLLPPSSSDESLLSSMSAPWA